MSTRRQVPAIVHSRPVWSRHGALFQTRAEHQQKREAEQRVGDLPRTIPKPAHIEMRKAYTIAHADLPKRLTPATGYIESKVSQMEDGELVAEPLSDILTLKDVEGAEESHLKLRNDGTVVLQKGKIGGAAPTAPSPAVLSAAFLSCGRCWARSRRRPPESRARSPQQ